MPRRTTLSEQREYAESRYTSYQREVKDAFREAEEMALRGSWAEVANKMAAVSQTVTAMAGTARELRMIYLLMEA